MKQTLFLLLLIIFALAGYAQKNLPTAFGNWGPPPTGIETEFDRPDPGAANQVSSNAILMSFYPNPASASSIIQISLERTTRAELKVYDILGHEVATLMKGILPAGEHTTTFPSALLNKKGAMFLVFTAEGKSQVLKVVVE